MTEEYAIAVIRGGYTIKRVYNGKTATMEAIKDQPGLYSVKWYNGRGGRLSSEGVWAWSEAWRAISAAGELSTIPEHVVYDPVLGRVISADILNNAGERILPRRRYGSGR